MVSADRTGAATIERLARELACERGVPMEHAREVVRDVLRLLREDARTAARVVIPGMLIVERAGEGARRRHRVRFVLLKRDRDEQSIRRLRDARRAAKLAA